jgi:anti-anti-sigma regulatory factor
MMESAFPVLRGVVEGPDETSIFTDGDALIISLPAVIELQVFTKINHAIDDVPSRSISYMLLDFSRVEKLGITGLATLLSLARMIPALNIRTLILDIPVQMRAQIDLLLPNACCIDGHLQRQSRQHHKAVMPQVCQ